MDACALYDVANIDPHSEFNPPIGRDLRVPLGHGTLDRHGATQRVHGACEHDQQAVASCPDYPTTVLPSLGFDQLGMVRVELRQGSFIVNTYQATVPDYIRHQDCHKPTL